MVTLKIIIAGGGIIGNSIAYYLAKRGSNVTLIDPVGIAPAASGKAGGFLARNMRDGTFLEELQRTSFDLHTELGQELSGTDYRRLTAAAVAIDGGVMQKPRGKKIKDVEWADRGVLGTASMGDEQNIAQVHPRKLCEQMWQYSESQGSRLHIGRVTKAIVENNSMKAVQLDDGTTMEADVLIVACGPWTEEARNWFPPEVGRYLPRITGTKAHSIVVSSPRVLSQAVFFQSSDVEPGHDLEVYPRPDGDVYVNGPHDPEGIVRERPGEEVVRQTDIETLTDLIGSVSTKLQGIEPHTKQVCYWPETPSGAPLIGPIPGLSGAYVAAGHSVWGILQGPATGKAMADLILDGETTIDISPYSIESAWKVSGFSDEL